MSKAFLEKILNEELMELAKLDKEFSGAPKFEIYVSEKLIENQIYTNLAGLPIEDSAKLKSIVSKGARDITRAIFNKYPKEDIQGTPSEFFISSFEDIKLDGLFTAEKMELENNLSSLSSSTEPLKPIISMIRPPRKTSRPLSLSISRKDTKTSTIFTIEVDSEKARPIIEKATRALLSRSHPGTWKGSDSREDIEKKKVIETFEKNIKPRSNVKKTKTNTRVKKSASKATKTVKSARTRKRGNIVGKLNVKAAKESSDVSLIALINAKLPAKLVENMKPPRLVWRTGRFAHSVRAIRNSKGVIEYTYMKYPYQTFEPGFAQGTVNRDPRSLISLSIRQITEEFYKKRFGTRRL